MPRHLSLNRLARYILRFRVESKETYLAYKRPLEEEVENTVGDTGAQNVLEVQFVALQHLVKVFGTPTHDNPGQVVLDHGNHRVGDASLLGRQASVQILAKLLTQFAEDDRAIRDLLAVQLDEGQRALLGVELHLVVDILKRTRKLLVACFTANQCLIIEYMIQTLSIFGYIKLTLRTGNYPPTSTSKNGATMARLFFRFSFCIPRRKKHFKMLYIHYGVKRHSSIQCKASLPEWSQFALNIYHTGLESVIRVGSRSLFSYTRSGCSG